MKVCRQMICIAMLLLLFFICGSGRAATGNTLLRGSTVLQGLRDLLHQKHPFLTANIRNFLSVPIGEPNCVPFDNKLNAEEMACFSEWSNRSTGAHLKLDFKQSPSNEFYAGTISLKPASSTCLKVEDAEVIFARPFKIDHLVVQEPRKGRAVPPSYRTIEYTDFGIPSYLISIEVSKSCITSIAVKSINEFKEK